MKTIKVNDDKDKLIITTINETEEIIKKSSLEGQRATLIKEHEEKLAEIDEKLAYFAKK